MQTCSRSPQKSHQGWKEGAEEGGQNHLEPTKRACGFREEKGPSKKHIGTERDLRAQAV